MSVESKGRSYEERLVLRRHELMSHINEVCKKVGRNASDVKIVAVSKTARPEQVVDAMNAGYTLFGENRPQELNSKLEFFENQNLHPEFHLIGNLQRNKINSILGKTTLIHSVDSLKLLNAIASRAERKNLVQDILLQVNVSGEESKSGFEPDEVLHAAELALDQKSVMVQGLMTMAPQGSQEAASKTFEGCRTLRDNIQAINSELLGRGELSMGMSEDFEIAIEHGATMLRLGRIIFDPDFIVNW